MKRRAVLVFIMLVSLVIVLVISPVFSQTAKPTQTAAKPIKIGGTLPLTGVASEPGKWVKVGYDFWVEDINRRGGLLRRPVEMKIYDDEGSVDKAITYYERVITLDKVDLLCGTYPGTTFVAIMALAEKYGMAYIGQGGHMKSFEQGYTYSFASPPLMAEWAYLALAGMIDDLIPKEERPKTMAVLTMNNIAGLSTRVDVIKSAEERGVKVVVDETYNLPLSDATPMISRAKSKGAEVLCFLSFFDDSVMMMRSARAMNYTPKLIFNIIASVQPAWVKELGEDGNYVTSNMFWNPRLPYSGNKELNEAAKARFGLPEAPTYFGMGYSWMKTLELAVQGAGTLDNKKIRDYLRSHKFDLPYGKGITFDKKGLPPAFAVTTQTTAGKVELVWPKEVATTKLVYPRPPWSK